MTEIAPQLLGSSGLVVFFAEQLVDQATFCASVHLHLGLLVW